MINSKLLQLFKILSAKDLRQVRKMLMSPFFSRNENLHTLFNVLRQQHPVFEQKAVQKGKIFARVFPDYTYSELKLRNLMVDLVKIIEQYFVLNQLDKKPLLHNKLLTEFLLDNNNLELVMMVNIIPLRSSCIAWA